jgi:exonuclease VII large subunit
MSAAQETRRQRLTAMERHLNALAPEQVLKRGYSITTLKKGGVIVRSMTQTSEGDLLLTRLADGVLESEVVDQKQMRLFD